MNTVYSFSGPFGSSFEVFADDGGVEVRFVGETLDPVAMIEADKAGDSKQIKALRFREIVADDWADERVDDKMGMMFWRKHVKEMLTWLDSN